jgi:hypothetical protein
MYECAALLTVMTGTMRGPPGPFPLPRSQPGAGAGDGMRAPPHLHVVTRMPGCP